MRLVIVVVVFILAVLGWSSASAQNGLPEDADAYGLQRCLEILQASEEECLCLQNTMKERLSENPNYDLEKMDAVSDHAYQAFRNGEYDQPYTAAAMRAALQAVGMSVQEYQKGQRVTTQLVPQVAQSCNIDMSGAAPAGEPSEQGN